MNPCRHLVALCLVCIACQGKGDEADHAAATAPEFPRVVGKSLKGDYVALEDFRGQVVLMNIWATWCKPCKEELPTLEALHQEYRSRGFTVLGISVDSERSMDMVAQMVRQFGLRYPVLLDPASRSVPTLKVTGYPTSFLVGRDGKIVWRRNGIIATDDAELLSNLQSALAAPTPAR